MRESRASLLVAMASVFIIACSDSTAPVARHIPGTYEFTTVLDSFTYPSNCTLTSNGTRCDLSRVAAGPSKIYGTFTLGDTIPGTWDAYQFPVSNIAFHQADCALPTTECAEGTSTWYGGSFTVKRDSLTFFGDIPGAVHVYLGGRFVDDRFVGTVSWYTYIGCCGSRYYSGTFVAARKP